MHPLIGMAILIGAAAFVVFAFRQGMRVPRSDRQDDLGAWAGRDSGPSHHADSGGSGQG
jgi:hypothetical protein